MLTDTEKARYEQLLSEPNPTPEELEELEYFVGKMSSEIHQSICHITGSSEATFSKKVPESELLDTCKDIWDHPSKYSDYADGSEGAYYKFLKVLWVEYPDGHEERLADIANDRVYPAL